MLLSADFSTELADVDLELGAIHKRVQGLHDLAEYEGLHSEVLRRLKSKANTLELIRSHLAEVPALAAQSKAGQ
jgi:hypothetical protein